MTQAWAVAFKSACRARKMRFVSGEGFVLDDVYIASLSPTLFHPDDVPDRRRIGGLIDIKPLAVDEILWAAFMPDVVMGPVKRLNHRIAGAFIVQALRLEPFVVDVAPDGEPNWDPVLDRFEQIRAEFVASYPTAADYVTALRERSDGIAPNRGRTRTVTALIAAGREADAVVMAERAIAAGEGGGMSSSVDVLKYLAAYAKGPHEFADFQRSLSPTHDIDVVCENEQSFPVGLARAHHRGGMARDLARMNGSDPWAVVLTARPPAGVPADYSTSLYLQAAGTAEAMLVEFCRPGGADLGAVSVRSVVGHHHAGSADLSVEIVLPHGIERVAAHEVFTADEATQLFETFYRTDTIGDQYALRWVEAYTADGEYVRPTTD